MQHFMQWILGTTAQLDSAYQWWGLFSTWLRGVYGFHTVDYVNATTCSACACIHN